MPKADKEFDLKADSDAVTAYLTVPEMVAKLLPFIESVDDKGYWIIKDQQAKITQTKYLVPTLTVESGGVVEWVGKGEKLTSTIRFEVKPTSRASKVKVAIAMEVDGALGTVLSPIISLNIKNQVDAVKRNLTEHFDDPGCYGEACTKCPMCGA